MKTLIVLLSIIAVIATLYALRDQIENRFGITLPFMTDEAVDMIPGTSIPMSNEEKDFMTVPERILPEGARAIDDYSFVYNNSVFFYPLSTTTALAVTSADANSFSRISDVMTHPDQSVATLCGVAGKYAYYADDAQVYFFQTWLTPRFKKSKIEVIVGAHKGDFSVTSLSTATNASTTSYDITYQAGTSTCTYIVKPSAVRGVEKAS